MSKRFKVGIVLFVISLAIFFFLLKKPATSKDTIKVGILNSLTGTLSIYEDGMAKAAQLAIDQLNQQGGLLGKQIEPILYDGKSSTDEFAKGAEQLLSQGVTVIFGGGTSAGRKLIKDIVEKNDHLYFYPFNYEGLEQSPNIFYTGPLTNQQMLPGIVWAFENLGKKFFLVGSDPDFLRIINRVLEAEIKSLGGTVVGNEYMELGTKDVKSIVQKIIEAKPEIIINNVLGDSIIPFFDELRAQGITPEKIPNMIFSLGEPELQKLGVAGLIGNYATWSYFQSIDSGRNKDFVTAYQKKYGSNSAINDSMESAYIGVQLWAKAVQESQSLKPAIIRSYLKGQSYDAPEGIIYIDPVNNHTWKFARIGKINASGQFNIIWDSEVPIKPLPYSPYFTKEEWGAFLKADSNKKVE